MPSYSRKTLRIDDRNIPEKLVLTCSIKQLVDWAPKEIMLLISTLTKNWFNSHNGHLKVSHLIRCRPQMIREKMPKMMGWKN